MSGEPCSGAGGRLADRPPARVVHGTDHVSTVCQVIAIIGRGFVFSFLVEIYVRKGESLLLVE